MFEKALEILTALAVALASAAGLGTAVDSVGRGVTADGAATASLADERAALEASWGLARAGEARQQADTAGADQATEALQRAMANAPEQAQPGLARAAAAVAARGEASEPETGGAAPFVVPPVAAPPVTTPVVAAPPVSAPPVDGGAPATTPPVPAPPVETPAGPPAELPGGRP